MQNPVADEFLDGSIELYFYLAPSDNKDFLRVKDLSRHHIVNVGGDLAALGMLHVGHLLRKTTGSEKLNARLIIIGPDDQGDGLQSVGDGFDILTAHKDLLYFFAGGSALMKMSDMKPLNSEGLCGLCLPAFLSLAGCKLNGIQGS